MSIISHNFSLKKNKLANLRSLMEKAKNIKAKLLLHKELIILLGIIILMFYPILIYPYKYIFPFSDVGIITAWREFLVDSYKNYGYLPLWNTYLFSGTSFIGNSQAAFFYPITLIYFLIPIDRAFGLIFVLDYFLVGFFTYLYARQIAISKSGSFITALMFCFNGALMKHLMLGHLIIMDTLAWFPLILLLIEKNLLTPRYKLSFYTGIVIGIMFLAGYPQMTIYILLTIFIYSSIRSFQLRNLKNFSFKKTIFILLLAIITGSLIAAIQLLPTYSFSKYTIRSNGIDYKFASDFSLSPKQIPSVVIPSLYGNEFNSTYWGTGSFWESSIYTGIIPFIIFPLALIYKRNKYTFIFLVMMIFSLLYSLGRFGPIFELFHKYMPFFNNFRVPTRFLFLYAFSFSVITGFSFDYLLHISRQKKSIQFRKFINYVLAITILGFLSAFLIISNKNNLDSLKNWLQGRGYALGIDLDKAFSNVLFDIYMLSFLLILFFLLLTLKYLKKLSLKKFYIIIIVLVLSDCLIFYHKFYYKNAFRNRTNYDAEIKFLKNDDSRFRIFPMATLEPSVTSLNKIESIIGYDPLYPVQYRDFMWDIGEHDSSLYENSITISRIENFHNLKLLNVKYIVTDDLLDEKYAEKVYKNKTNIYELKNLFPRAFIIYSHKPNFIEKNLPSTQASIIKIYEPDLISVNAKMSKPGFLILSETYDPDWVAYDNGVKIDIIKSNKIFRAVYLKEGDHNVVFKYKPRYYYYGRLISSTTIIVIIILFTYSIIKKGLFLNNSLYTKIKKQFNKKLTKNKFL